MASSTQIDTASAIRRETARGSHLFKIFGYSMIKGIGIRKWIGSVVFTIGGHDWAIRYYPDGDRDECKNFMAVFLESKSNATNLKAHFTFTILQPNGVPSNMTWTSGLVTFRSTTDTSYTAWGLKGFVKITDFEASKCLKDDSFTLKCTVTVAKDVIHEKISPYGITVPPSILNQNLLELLESGLGTDITFVVKGERFSAHRCVLAARSAVFRAELLGGMKENWTDTITVDDIEAPAFQSLLHFIYSDSLPDDGGEKQDMSLMPQHLLVAADRYQLERLRLMCEDLLYKSISVSNVAETLILAERHNGTQLKEQCLRFMSSHDVFKVVALTEGFHNLVKICPSVLKDI